jgi:hypothetical protein
VSHANAAFDHGIPLSNSAAKAAPVTEMTESANRNWFSAIESDLDYLVFRVDPQHVLPAGYVHPLLKP